MRYLLPLVLYVLVNSGCNDDDDTLLPVVDQVGTIIVADQAVFPEGMAYSAATNTVYTGSSATGTIYRGKTTDARLSVFTLSGTPITNALGMETSGDTLYIAGGAGNTAYRVNLTDNSVRGLSAAATAATDSSLINDVTVAANGTAYLTNSYLPVIYRYEGGDSLQSWLDLTGTAIDYGDGFNLNGIAITPDGRYLLVVQTNTGKLFRVEIASKSVTEVNLSGSSLRNGDGIDLVDGNVLYVAINQDNIVATVVLNNNYTVAEVTQVFTGGFLFPTAVAGTRDSVLVLNAQLNAQAPGQTPTLPFTITKFARR